MVTEEGTQLEGTVETGWSRFKDKVPEVCQHHVIDVLIKSTLMQLLLANSVESGFQRLGEGSRVDVSRRMPTLDVGLLCLHSQGPTLPHRLRRPSSLFCARSLSQSSE